MADVEKGGIQVSVLPAKMQDPYGTNLEGVGMVYPLKARSISANSRSNVVFLFPTTNYEPPKHVNERLAGQTVKVHSLAWVEGMTDHVVAPTPASLKTVNSMVSDQDVVPIPEEFRDRALADLTTDTKGWFEGWLHGFTLRGVYERWDPYQLLDPFQFTDELSNKRSVDSVTRLIEGAPTQSLDPNIASNLVTGIINPGLRYDAWMDSLRGFNADAYQAVLATSPRIRHQALFDASHGKGVILKAPLSNVINEDPYDLDKGVFGGDIEALARKYDQAIGALQGMSESPRTTLAAQSVFYRLGISLQLARERATWFIGRDARDSEILTMVNELKPKHPFLTAFLRSMEITHEGQEFSTYLRGQFIKDPKREAYKPAA